MRSWFIIDLLSILPFDVVGKEVSSNVVSSLKLVRIVRLLRLLKLVRIMRASRIFKRLESRISVSYSIIGLVQFTVLLLVCSHWMACLWAMGARLEDESAYTWLHALCVRRSAGWLDDERATPKRMIDDDAAAKSCAVAWRHFEVYTASLYWAITSITSVGYGDILPTSPGEMRLATFALLSGGILWAYIIGSACGIISTLDVATVSYTHLTLPTILLV